MSAWSSAARAARAVGILYRHGALAPLAVLPGSGAGPRAARLIGWLATPAGLEPETYGARLAEALSELGPTFVKLGQVLATRADLVGPEIARALGALQDRVTPFPMDVARETLAAALEAPVETLFEAFGPPVAAASIAQVHFAVTREGAPVAVKILRPGIEDAMARDLDDMARVARLVARFGPEAERLRPEAVIETLARSVAIELDLRMEASAAAELGERHRGDPEFRVPAVDWRRTARRVMTLERVEGLALTDLALVLARHDGAVLARRLVQTFLRQAMIEGFFHADLHPGNLFIAEDGALVAVDFGIMGRLDAASSRFLALILKGFVQRDYRAIADLHFEAGYVPADQDPDAFAQALRAVGEPIFDRPAAEISMGRLLTQLFEVTARFGMRTQPQLLLLQKTMVVVEGVARQLDPTLNMFETAKPVIAEWLDLRVGPAATLRAALKDAETIARALPRLAEMTRAPQAAAGRPGEDPGFGPSPAARRSPGGLGALALSGAALVLAAAALAIATLALTRAL